MKNYKPVLQQYSSSRLRDYVKPYTDTIVYRTYVNGNSRDTRRDTIPYEETILENLMLSALYAIRYADNAADVAINTAEYAVDLLLPGVNGYMSLYIPLCNILKELETDLKEVTPC